MHRSGTSALSRTLNLLGADLPSEVLGPSANNPLGHWEPKVVYELNNELLESLGSSWHALSPLPIGWSDAPEAEAFARRAADFLIAEFGKSRMFVLKEPRMCLLAPVWMKAARLAGMDARVIVPIRHPYEVACSLHARSKMPLSEGGLVWLRNTLEGEAQTRNLSRCFITYDHLLKDWRSVIAGIGRSLDIDWPTRTPETEAEIDRFLSPEHRHHRSGDAMTTSSWFDKTLEALSALVDDPYDAVAMVRLDAVRGAFDTASSVFAPVVSDVSAEVLARANHLRHQQKRLRRIAEEHAERVQLDLDKARASLEEATHFSGRIALETRLSTTQEALAAQQAETESWRTAAVRCKVQHEEMVSMLRNEHRTQLDAVSARFDGALNLLGKLKMRCAELELGHAELSRQAAEWFDKVAELNEIRAKQEMSLRKLAKRVTALETEIAAGVGALSAAKFKRNLRIQKLESEIAERQQRLDAAVALAAYFEQKLHAVERDKTAIEQSTSWRLTQPIRHLARLRQPHRRIGRKVVES